jgi:hypothetical protein
MEKDQTILTLRFLIIRRTNQTVHETRAYPEEKEMPEWFPSKSAEERRRTRGKRWIAIISVSVTQAYRKESASSRGNRWIVCEAPQMVARELQ